METAQTVKKDTKLELVESQVKDNDAIIIEIFERVKLIETNLGEQNDLPKDDGIKTEESPYRFNRLRENLSYTGSNLRDIRDRLQNISELF